MELYLNDAGDSDDGPPGQRRGEGDGAIRKKRKKEPSSRNIPDVGRSEPKGNKGFYGVATAAITVMADAATPFGNFGREGCQKCSDGRAIFPPGHDKKTQLSTWAKTSSGRKNYADVALIPRLGAPKNSAVFRLAPFFLGLFISARGDAQLLLATPAAPLTLELSDHSALELPSDLL